MKTTTLIAFALTAASVTARGAPAQVREPSLPDRPKLEAASLDRLAGLAPLAAGAPWLALEHALGEMARIEHVIPAGTLAGLERLEMLETAVPQGLAGASMALAFAEAALAASAPALAWLGTVTPRLQERSAAGPRPAWATQDPADSLYRAAREALNRNDYARAADLFGEIIRRYPRSEYAPDAYYWQAFALYRKGGVEDLRAAVRLLDQQKARHPKAATLAESEALATRVRGQLARLGDADAAESLTKAAAGSEAACSSENDEVRAAALNALLQMDAGRAMPILEKVLARRDACSAPLRRRAVFLVSQKVTPETEDILLDLVRNDPDREVREQAVFWLSQVDTDRAVAALLQILQSTGDARVQEKAIFALSQHDGEQAANALRAYASRADAPAKLRENAIFWIGQKRSADDARFLRDLYGRLGDEKLREKVIFSLSQMGGQDNERWLMQVALDTAVSVGLRKSALFWAGQAGAPLGELTGLYDRMRGREMKKQLIFVYSQRNDPDAVGKLIEIARNERDPELRKAAIFWLGQSDDPRAAEFLLEIISHD